MAFFKFRKGGDEPIAATAQPESVEAMRRRARHRLIGAAVLVLAGVIGFPLLFDTQPRPIAVDIPIDIPDRHKARPLPAPVAADPLVPERKVPPASVASGPVATKTEAPVVRPAAEPKPETRPAPAVQAPPSAAVAAVPESKAPVRPVVPAKATPVAPTPAADDGARARALLEGRSAEEAEARFVVQVGSFSDVAKAREVRMKVERAGLKTYTHVAETKDGKRIRVRVGPYASRAEADKAATKVKGLDLPAAILAL